MAEPYDTVNGITAGAPKNWWRFSDASGGVTGEGTVTSRDLGETSAGALGTFNWTYQYEANPAGDGYGMLAGGSGGLVESSDVFTGGTGTEFTMMAVYRTTATSAHANAQFFGGYFQGSDIDYCRMFADDTGVWYATQDNSSDDRVWKTTDTAGKDLFDEKAHSICVVSPTGTSGTLPTMYIDGIALTGVAVTYENGTVNDNWSPVSDFNPDMAIGFRGGNNSSPVGELVYYEWLGYDHHLSATEVLDVHLALTGGEIAVSFADKSLRVSNRRMIYDHTA